MHFCIDVPAGLNDIGTRIGSSSGYAILAWPLSVTFQSDMESIYVTRDAAKQV